jgi:hypothetical protein
MGSRSPAAGGHRGGVRRWRWPAVAAVVVLAAVVAVVAVVAVGTPSAHRRASGAGAHAHPAPGGGSPSAVFPGPDGVRAAGVIAENRPGTTAWRITGRQRPDGIQGYASAVAAQVGQTVRLFVSTPATTFRVEAFRMGYYQGRGARLVWSSGPQQGRRQPACPVTPGINMVQCRWAVSLSVRVTRSWVQGEYLLKLVGSGGQQSYVPLTVWDPASTATYVIMDASLTEQAFNTFGGYDFYQGATPCAPGVYPCSSRARVVSFDRPYTAPGDGGYLGLTYPLTRLAEEHGLDVTYWTNITLDEHGALLSRHRMLISPAHDEEWSLTMRQAATRALGRGGNIAFFGASPVLRKVRLQPSPLGPDREEVNYRDPMADPLYGRDNAQVSQNDWAQPPADDPASGLVGATYIGYNNFASFPLVVSAASSWLFAGSGLTDGEHVPGVLRSDFQAYQPGEAGPDNVEIQAHSPVQVELHGAEYADTSYYTLGSGGGVWQSGTNNWIPALGSCVEGRPCPAAVLAKMTLNVLRVLGAGPLGRHHPSRPNWRRFYPP